MFTISSQAAAVNFITKMHFFNCTNHINSFNKAQSPDNKYPMQLYMGSYVSTNNKIHSSSDWEIDPKNLSCQLQCTVIQECLVSYKHAKVNLLFQQTLFVCRNHFRFVFVQIVGEIWFQKLYPFSMLIALDVQRLVGNLHLSLYQHSL